MISSIGKFSKSIFAKILVAIIALPFILWGMGDVFRTGNQNIIVEINNYKISTKEFMNFLQAVNITNEDIQKKGKERIINEVLTNYISEKIVMIETKEKGIRLSDYSIKEILVSDEEFRKDNKFLRTKYEKFLLTNGITAPDYEKNIYNLESKGQLLSFYSGGIKLPNFLVKDLFNKENKIKELSVIDLEKVYSKKEITKDEINKFYNNNKNFFKDKFISFKYLELLPIDITGENNYDKEYFGKIEKIENDILDGKSFDDIVTFDKKNIKTIDLVNSKKKMINGKGVKINDDLLKEVFKINFQNAPSFININNKFFIAEITKEENNILDISNKNVLETIKKQLKIVNLIKENNSITKKIEQKKFSFKQMLEMSNKFQVPIQKIKIQNIKDTSNFNNVLLQQIYNYNSDQIFVITDYPIAKKNYLVKIDKEISPTLKYNSEVFKEYSNKANAQYISKVYKSYDGYINSIYKININEKVLERLINSI